MHVASSAPPPARSDDPLDEYEEFDFAEINLRQAALRDVQELKTKLRAAIQKRRTARNVTLRDKISFVIGTTLCLLSAYWLGFSPATFNRSIYTGGVVVLFTLRYVIYRVRKWHYYVYDFCYYANLLMLYHIWVAPHSVFLHKVTFAFGMGPLAWSIIAFRNSLVFHSLDKSTSLFLHWFPAVVGWTQRWHHDEATEELLRRDPELLREWDHATLAQLVLYPLLPYLLWAVAYYFKVFVISSKKIQLRGYETLYSYMTRKPTAAVARFVSMAPRRWQPVAYMGLHVTLTTATFALTKLWWNSYHAHTAFLAFIFCWAVWNGANFYFEHFAHKYISGLPRPASESAFSDGTVSPQASISSPLSARPPDAVQPFAAPVKLE